MSYIQTVKLVDKSLITEVLEIPNPNERNDHADYCEPCALIGGYCGNCNGSYFWHYWKYDKDKNGFYPTETLYKLEEKS